MSTSKKTVLSSESLIQCDKCQKRLKYTGTKRYIACPNCGDQIPIVNNIPDNETIHQPPPVQTVVSSNSNPQLNSTTKKVKQFEVPPIELVSKKNIVDMVASSIDQVSSYDFNNATKKGLAVVKTWPVFPSIVSSIWLVWLLFCFGVYLWAWSKASVFGDYLMVGGRMFGRGEWSWVCLQATAYFGAAGVVVATIASVLAYIWIQALQKNPRPH